MTMKPNLGSIITELTLMTTSTMVLMRRPGKSTDRWYCNGQVGQSTKKLRHLRTVNRLKRGSQIETSHRTFI